ncbi:MAG: RNA-binding S4 domain-containing protein [Pseudomonadota bacterium]
MTRSEPGEGAGDRQRADKWLWQARFFKTRRLAAELLSAGRVRLNGAHLRKPSAQLRPGDMLTFPQGRQIRVVRVLALPVRRGPAAEAQALYEDLTPSETARDAAPGDPRPGARAGPRPTKKDRRKIHLSRRSSLE